MEKYFVVSGGDEPYKLFFDFETAADFADTGDYIDSFDENGDKVNSVKFIGQREWTEKF